MIFPSVKFTPGSTRIFKYRLFVLNGLSNPLYLNKNLALEILDIPSFIKPDSRILKLKIVALSPILDYSTMIKMELRDSSGHSVPFVIKMKNLNPETPIIQTVEVPLRSLHSGRIHIFIMHENGKGLKLPNIDCHLK